MLGRITLEVETRPSAALHGKVCNQEFITAQALGDKNPANLPATSRLQLPPKFVDDKSRNTDPHVSSVGPTRTRCKKDISSPNSSSVSAVSATADGGSGKAMGWVSKGWTNRSQGDSPMT